MHTRFKVGTVDRESVFITIQYPRQYSASNKPGLSIMADIYRSGHFVGGGQSIDTVRAVATRGTLAKGRTFKEIMRLVEVWKRWHLNDMRAGCEHQRAAGWDRRPIDPARPTSEYISLTREGERISYYTGWNMLVWIRPTEHPDGLLTVPCPECGYAYGTAWRHEPIPEDVLTFLATFEKGD